MMGSFYPCTNCGSDWVRPCNPDCPKAQPGHPYLEARRRQLPVVITPVPQGTNRCDVVEYDHNLGASWRRYGTDWGMYDLNIKTGMIRTGAGPCPKRS